MRIRKIALTLFACTILGFFAATTAEAGQWTLGTANNQSTAGTKIVSEAVKCKKHPGSQLAFSFTFLIPVKFKATQVDCVNASIDTTSLGVDHSDGKFEFTTATAEPSSCSVPSEKIVTNTITDEVITDPTTGSTVFFDKYFTESGGPWFTVTLEGAECPLLEAPISVKGTACGESVHTTGTNLFAPNTTGTLTITQTQLFGEAQQTTGGCELKVGNAKAELSGAIDYELSGANVTKPWGAD